MGITSLDNPGNPLLSILIQENVNMVKLNQDKTLLAAALDAYHIPIFDTRTNNI